MIDVASYFRDPDGGPLTYAAATSAPSVVSVSISGSSLTMFGVADGTATVTVTATDPGGLSATQSVGVTVQTPNRAPAAVGSIPARSANVGQTVTLDVASYFSDPDGDALGYGAATSAAGVVSVSMSGSSLTMVGVADGTATVTITATDPGGLTATQSFAVAVHGSFRDDFDSPASLNDWNGRNDTNISAAGGVLSLTNRTQGRLGIAERASPPTLNAWTVSARMGRTTRRASPGVASLTGHRRFTAARLVLRTLDDSGSDRSADSPRTSGNYEFALFDRDTREWVRIANMSGRSAVVREAPNEFTDITLGHEGGDFVGYAGTANSEEIFRFDMDDSTVDGVALRDILEHLTGVWLVNQGAAGLISLHDWVRVTGTGSSAAAPDGAGIAESTDVATRSVNVAGPDADRAALVAFYRAAGGLNWTNNAGWRTNAPLDDWFGVTATTGDAVTAVNLQTNNLVGVMPPELGNLASLTRLDLSFNQLREGVPSELGNLTNLTRLILSDNQLRGTIPRELGRLGTLEGLTLAGNRLTGAIPPELGTHLPV
ncbi:MAG: hypothetical protein OXU74_01365 [Gemmatimonadota bacterium]|nr:hypothetical protein [Gemmatimonadota bacterium]